jgi:hypothetical protein
MRDWRGGPPTGRVVPFQRPVVPERVEPPVTIAEMVATYRAVAPRCAPTFAAVLRDIMVRCVAGMREPGSDG